MLVLSWVTNKPNQYLQVNALIILTNYIYTQYFWGTFFCDKQGWRFSIGPYRKSKIYYRTRFINKAKQFNNDYQNPADLAHPDLNIGRFWVRVRVLPKALKSVLTAPQPMLVIMSLINGNAYAINWRSSYLVQLWTSRQRLKNSRASCLVS